MTTTTITRIVAVLALTTYAVALGAAETAPIHVAGMVVDTAGKPIAGAVVESYENVNGDMKSLSRLTTGSDGAFRFESASGAVSLLCVKPGLAPSWAQYRELISDRTNEHLTLAAPAPVEGLVTDETGKPVANAEVWVSTGCLERRQGTTTYADYVTGKRAQELFTTRTAADGRFRFDNFPAHASADLEMKAPGLYLRSLERTYIGPDTMRCVAGEHDVRLVVEHGGAIEGKVIADDTGQPLPGATLQFRSDRPTSTAPARTTQTDSQGKFSLGELAPAVTRC